MHFADEEIIADFKLDPSALDGWDVLFYDYSCSGSSSDWSAFALLAWGDQLYEVHASHCSCYGLEGQWSPEFSSIECIESQLAEGASDYCRHSEGLREAIAQFKDRAGPPRVV